MTKTWLKQEIGEQIYKVEGIDRPITDDELIDYCDPSKWNWGGRVRRCGTEAIVIVYVD